MFQRIIEECKLRNYSKQTQKAYLYYNKKFLEFCRKEPREVQHKDVREYILHLIEQQKSSSTVNLAHNALRFYYCIIMKRRFEKIAFCKREQKIKEILTKKEINTLIHTVQNPKHKALISLLYCSGLRVSELIKLKVLDINHEQKIIHVRQGKGCKDRFTILSEKTLGLLDTYLSTRKTKSPYVFDSRKGHITSRTVQETLKKAAKKANFTKHVHPHLLRHSFATHHLHNNTPTEYVQGMLGHKDIRTTRKYLTLLTDHLSSLQSPHDT